MFYFVVLILFVTFGIVTSGVQNQIEHKPTEQLSQPSGNLEITQGQIQYGDDEYIVHGDGGEPDGKYASGAQLTSLAHSSALQAKNAVQNQHTAGNQAAFGAKSSLANAAIGAAMTAQAALVGKQVIVQGLKKQLNDAQHQLQAQIGQYQQAQQSASAAEEAAHQAQVTATALSGAVTAAQGSAQIASKTATQAAAAAASQHSMVVETKQRLTHITEQLHNALNGLHETEIAAQKAIAAANIAQSNAAAAGAAVVTASQNAHNNQEHEQESGGKGVIYYE